MLDHLHDPLGTKLTPDMLEATQMEKRACDNLSNEDTSSLPDTAFAHTVEFGDRYYPCHTPEHLVMSRAYLHKYHDDMPTETFNKVASYLEGVAAAFGLPAWSADFAKSASEPIDEFEKLALDALEFERNYKQAHVDSRRSTAKELYARADEMGKVASLPHIVLKYARCFLSPDYMRAIDARRRFFADGSPERRVLVRIGMDSESVSTEDLLSILRAFDEDNGLTAHYDNDLLDPYLGLLGDTPPFERAVYRDADHTVYERDVFGEGMREKLKGVVGDGVIDALYSNFADTIGRVRPEMRVVILRTVCDNN